MTQASQATTRPQRNPRPEPPRRLRIIPARIPQRKMPFLLFVGVTVVAGVLGLAALSVAVNQQAFRISELTTSNRELEEHYSVLQAEVDKLRSPARIAEIARERGLRPVTRARIERWPNQAGTNNRAKPGEVAAPSPAATELEAGDPTKQASGHVWTLEDPFPLKHYLAQP